MNESESTFVNVTFDSQGERVAGQIFRAAFSDGPAPGIVVIGPENFQKEQAPTLYAQQFSALGFTTLIFDPRYRGESGGEPRCYESPTAKIEDTRAAFRYLSKRSDVDETRLFLVGICFGAAYSFKTAADESLVRGFAAVTGHYRDHATDAQWLGGEEIVAKRLARGKAARQKYEKTGKADYVPAVDFERIDVGMPGISVWSWYQLWADRGLWENRYAVMSDEAVLNYESLSSAARLHKPLLMIHSDQCAFPDTARRHFAVVPTQDKKLIWKDSTRHFQFYDDQSVIYDAALDIIDWFSRHLI